MPYSQLDPSLILNAIESVDVKCTGSLFALNSYENRVYQIGIEDSQPLIAKFYRPHRWSHEAIIEEHQFALELALLDIPVVAPLSMIPPQTLYLYNNFPFALFPRQGGRALELDNLEHLEWIGRFIGRLHTVGACKKFQHRLNLNVQSYGYNPYHFLIEQNFIPTELKQNYSFIVESALAKIMQKFEQINPQYIRLHGDCHVGNILWNDSGPRIVDLDDCLMGPAIQDIWMLLSGNTEDEINLQLNKILKGYREFCDFNFREVHLIEALRTLRMIHYSAWLARRWNDPTFPLNFPWFNTMHYWQEQLRHLDEQLLLLDSDII
jgi:Ser/Thr protein kinase RdoA (MazF antagonist)